MDIPPTVKNNALLYLHSYCQQNSDKIQQELVSAGCERTAEEFKQIVQSMPEPASAKPQ
jgi:hypothetical protein